VSPQAAALLGELLFLAAAFAFDLYCLRALKDAPRVLVFSRETWFCVILLATPLGGMTYLTIGRPR
jgi:hypothetical protein